MEYIKLPLICNLKQWKTIPTKELVDSGYPVYGANGIIGFYHQFNHTEATVMICCRGATCGAINISAEKCYINGNAMCLDNLSKEFDIHFIAYFLKHFNWTKIITGTAQPQITQIGLSGVLVPKIPLKEQQKIVAELDNIEEGIRVKEEQLKTLDELIQSRFTEMFEQQTFEVKPIRALVSDNIKTTKKVFTKDDEIEYIDISSIDNTQNTITGTTKYVVAQAPSRAQQHIQYNDILVSTVRPNLKNIAINKHTGPNLIASSGFCVLRAKECVPEYLLYNVLSNQFTAKMITLTTGASYPAIRDNDVLDWTIPVPPLPLQNQFAEFVQKVEKAKEIVKIQIDDLRELLALKMDEYFR